MKKICFNGLKKVMSPKEMKNILGGSGWCDHLKTCTSKSDCDVLTQNCGLTCGDVKKCY